MVASGVSVVEEVVPVVGVARKPSLSLYDAVDATEVGEIAVTVSAVVVAAAFLVAAGAGEIVTAAVTVKAGEEEAAFSVVAGAGELDAAGTTSLSFFSTVAGTAGADDAVNATDPCVAVTSAVVAPAPLALALSFE